MAKIQHYGIKFPITVESDEKTLFDLNLSPVESVKSQIMHIVFTPLGQRLRKPSFGTRLIQFIFNPNDSQTWGDIVVEIKDVVKRNIPECTINDVKIVETDDGLGLRAEISFSVSKNGRIYTDKISTNL